MRERERERGGRREGVGEQERLNDKTTPLPHRSFFSRSKKGKSASSLGMGMLHAHTNMSTQAAPLPITPSHISSARTQRGPHKISSPFIAFSFLLKRVFHMIRRHKDEEVVCSLKRKESKK
jgi:hypothetical protein